MSEEKMTCPDMSVNRMVGVLSAGYTKVVKDGSPIQKMPSVMLWGPPGVGKSQGIRQVASRVEKATGKKVIVTDVRLVLFNPVDLRGIPTFDETRSFAVWLKPKILDMDESDDVINFLFLDEISAAPPSVQAAAYQIALDRRIGEHQLPANCAVLAAGNRMSDKSVSFKMPRALANRMMHFEILPDLRSWTDWANRSGVDQRVIGFLSFRKDWFIEKGDSNAVAFPTPRTWEMVSDVLRFCEPDIKKAKPMI
ncbi:MAG: AAA family ATPase, partial [Bacilli bacterium]|nr:AAA family ATPase [Bacilli bacterium]